MALPEVDAVIIGVGWAGSILASELTKAGLQVVGLERGPARGTQDFQHDHDELRFGVHQALFRSAAVETQTLRHNLRETALPIRWNNAFPTGTGVGGCGVHWSGQTWRFLPYDFSIRSTITKRYGADAIPSDVTVQDWGITYEEIEPYYDTWEYMAGISGKAGNIKGTIQPGGNPFEGPRNREYPTPPMKTPISSAMFRDAAQKLGYKPFPTPSANLSELYTNPDGITRAGCTYCGFCTAYGCEVGAKADPTVTVLPVALKTGKFEIRTESYAYQIKHDGKRAQSVLYYDSKGQPQEQPARLVLVTAYELNNVRLLLLSKLGTPYDPQTGKGAVGKNYAWQPTIFGTGWFDDTEFHNYMGSGANGWSMDEFNADNFDHKGLDFLGGGVITVINEAAAIGGVSVPPGTPPWGKDWKTAVRQYYDHGLSIAAQLENLAYRTHCLDLDPTYRDMWGLPLLRITYDYEDNDQKLTAFLAKKMTEVLQTAGAGKIAMPDKQADHFDAGAGPAVVHNTGGAIMGSDPSTSVVNSYLQMWECDNVFVVGGSAFPQNAGRNPTGTIGALSYRAADGIVNKYLKNPGPLQ